MESLETMVRVKVLQCVVVFQFIHTIWFLGSQWKTVSHILFFFGPVMLFYHLYCIYFSMRKRWLGLKFINISSKVNLDMFPVCSSVAVVAWAHVESARIMSGCWFVWCSCSREKTKQWMWEPSQKPSVYLLSVVTSSPWNSGYWLTWTHFKIGKSRPNGARGVAPLGLWHFVVTWSLGSMKLW